MTGFDIAIIVVVALSTVLAMMRGVVRELVALAAWFVGIAAAISFSGAVAEQLGFVNAPPLARELLAFVLILVVVLIAGALTGALLRGAVRVDRAALSRSLPGRRLRPDARRARGGRVRASRRHHDPAAARLVAEFVVRARVGGCGAVASPLSASFVGVAAQLFGADAGTCRQPVDRNERVAWSERAMCGIVGAVATTPVNQLLYDGLLLLQHRGQDAAGIATGDGPAFHMHKGSGSCATCSARATCATCTATSASATAAIRRRARRPRSSNRSRST